jgi:hypothetical protein
MAVFIEQSTSSSKFRGCWCWFLFFLGQTTFVKLSPQEAYVLLYSHEMISTFLKRQFWPVKYLHFGSCCGGLCCRQSCNGIEEGGCSASCHRALNVSRTEDRGACRNNFYHGELRENCLCCMLWTAISDEVVQKEVERKTSLLVH